MAKGSIIFHYPSCLYTTWNSFSNNVNIIYEPTSFIIEKLSDFGKMYLWQFVGDKPLQPVIMIYPFSRSGTAAD